MARVVLPAPFTSSSPGMTRRTSSTVAPHRTCHGCTTDQWTASTAPVAAAPTASPGHSQRVSSRTTRQPAASSATAATILRIILRVRMVASLP
jgi:hypothetical protein